MNISCQGLFQKISFPASAACFEHTTVDELVKQLPHLSLSNLEFLDGHKMSFLAIFLAKFKAFLETPFR